MVDALYHSLKLSYDLFLDYDTVVKYSSSKFINNRNYAVRWMKQCLMKVLGEVCPSTRDTTIQVLDRYLMTVFQSDEQLLNDLEFLAYAAAASVLIGAKLHDTRSEITMSKFSFLDIDRLKMTEQEVMARTAMNVSPLCTPAVFLHHLMNISPANDLKEVVLEHANNLVATFWEDGSSVLFAPSTIAISAILMSYSMQKVSCTDWLNAIPSFCFMNDHNPLFDQQRLNAMYLDTNNCITKFENILHSASSGNKHSPAKSPTGIHNIERMKSCLDQLSHSL